MSRSHIRIIRSIVFLGILVFYSMPSPSGKVGRIPVILSSDTEIYARGLNGIQATISARLQLHYLDALSESTGGHEAFFASLESSALQFPMIITIGPRATRAALKHLKKIPIVFTMVSAPRTLGPKVGGHCGVTMDVPVGRYFETLKGNITGRKKRIRVLQYTGGRVRCQRRSLLGPAPRLALPQDPGQGPDGLAGGPGQNQRQSGRHPYHS